MRTGPESGKTRALTLLACVLCALPAFSQVPDLSGTWVGIPAAGEDWNQATLPLTEAARERLAAFDAKKHDSTYFCMPFGTPRNTLETAERPLRIIQTDAQLTLLFDGLGDVRRVFVDGRPHPEDPIPSWMGHSIGHWDEGTLLIDTIAMTSESILGEQGLPHSDAMQVHEQLRLVERDGEALLQLDLRLEDPGYYSAPLTRQRHFRRAPQAAFSEGSSHCLLDQWRRRLEELNRAMFRDLQAPPEDQAQ